ncbi:hypothetical protein Tco_1115762, partial [Tanacetum coccineum]
IVDKGIATLKTSEKHHKPSDSDDDFVKSPTRPRLICHKRKVSENKKELKKRQKFDNVSDIMIKSTSNGPVNQKFLANIETNTVIDNLDWCTYTLDCLNESRKTWNKLDPSNFYTGPLLFLVVFYMKSTMLNGQDKVCGIIPSMNRWTTNQLKDRQRKEVQNGAIKGEDVEVGEKGHKAHLTADAVDLQDIVNEVKRNVAVITSAKSLVYENISKGLDMFPNNKDLLTLEKECDVLFGENSHGVNVHQDGNGNKENVNDSYVEVPGIITQTLT